MNARRPTSNLHDLELNMCLPTTGTLKSLESTLELQLRCLHANYDLFQWDVRVPRESWALRKSPQKARN